MGPLWSEKLADSIARDFSNTPTDSLRAKIAFHNRFFFLVPNEHLATSFCVNFLGTLKLISDYFIDRLTPFKTFNMHILRLIVIGCPLLFCISVYLHCPSFGCLLLRPKLNFHGYTGAKSNKPATAVKKDFVSSQNETLSATGLR